MLLNLHSNANSNPTLWPAIGRSDRGRGERAWETPSKPRQLPHLPRCGRADPTVSFLRPSQLDVVRFRQLFQRFSKAVHAGLLIVKLL